jgi:16S rRNA (guanine966-N2)-methyltransferase
LLAPFRWEFVRIIAGEFRRRRLLVNPGLTTRPITDRVKEILFERIGHWLADARVADVFSGTGSLGLEALSRGARCAVFIESDRLAFDLLERNVAALGVESRAFCWRTDARKSSFRPKGVDEFLPFDVVFFDPPYRLSEPRRGGSGPLADALRRLARPGVTSGDAWLFFRTSEGVTPACPPPWQHQTTHLISSMAIHVYRKVPDGQ